MFKVNFMIFGMYVLFTCLSNFHCQIDEFTIVNAILKWWAIQRSNYYMLYGDTSSSMMSKHDEIEHIFS